MKIGIRNIFEHPIGYRHGVPDEITRRVDIDQSRRKLECSGNSSPDAVAGRDDSRPGIRVAFLLPNQGPAKKDRIILITEGGGAPVIFDIIGLYRHRAVIRSAGRGVLQAQRDHAVRGIAGNRHDLIVERFLIHQECRDGIGLPIYAAYGCRKKRQRVDRDRVPDDRRFAAGRQDTKDAAQHQQGQQDLNRFHIIRLSYHTRQLQMELPSLTFHIYLNIYDYTRSIFGTLFIEHHRMKSTRTPKIVLAFLAVTATAILTTILTTDLAAQGPVLGAQGPAVIAYYSSRSVDIDSFDTRKLTHIIFSFCHLKGNLIDANNLYDSGVIQRLVALKNSHPGLKIILSLGGWGGCRSCPQVFSTKKGRRQFARSVRKMEDYFHADGIDLDWEYPALSNVPGYPFGPEDKDNFTQAIKQLRKKLDKHNEISFAAGGFTKYLSTSIDWKKVSPLVNYINLMTYDLVSGYDTVTGHHTPLYSSPRQVESTDHAVRFLDSIGVPLAKIVIGAAFYARIFEHVDSVNEGLYRPGRFRRGVSYRNFSTELTQAAGFVPHWDPVAQAPFLYNASQQLFVTFDDSLSIRLKTRYALDKHLGGIMFWQLGEDRFTNGLLDVIDETKKEKN
jgi:chitinase